MRFAFRRAVDAGPAFPLFFPFRRGHFMLVEKTVSFPAGIIPFT